MTLPFADLLAELRAAGLPVGVHEHLAVGRLLGRWDRLEAGEMKDALAALLARNRVEVELVQQTFDRLYGAPEPAPESTAPGIMPSDHVPPPSSKRHVPRIVLALLVLGGTVWLLQTDAARVVIEPGKLIKVLIPSELRWYAIATAVSLVTGLLGLLWVRRPPARTHLWRRKELIQAPPGSRGYGFVLRGLVPPFDPELLDDLSALLARSWASAGGKKVLDARRSIARTLDAGLAPQLVWRHPSAYPPLLILEDIGEEMASWRWRIESLLDGLAARGVDLDRWFFRTDADLVFPAPDEPGIPLSRLAHLRPGHRLVVISTGLGLLEGEEERLAGWVERLTVWEERIWLHPSPSASSRRPALAHAPMDVFSMDPTGLLTAAGTLAHARSQIPKRSPKRIHPADVEQLRWLVSLAPRRDPRLAERLRQEFCPEIPAAALPEALAAPPPRSKPQSSIAEVDVHRFLLRVLDDSRPPEGTAGWERWRLDRAVQEAAVDPTRSGELEALAEGPLRGALMQALTRGPLAERLPPPQLRRLRVKVRREPVKATSWASFLGRLSGAPRELLKAMSSWRTTSVMLMSFASGIPLGLVWLAIPDWMGKIGVDIRLIGFFTLAQAPWTFKFLWAPLVDRFVPPRLGRRRGWVILAQIALVLSMLTLAGVGSQPELPWVVMAIALAIALAGATQDVAIDAYAVDVLRPEEQAVAVGGRNAFYRAGFYIAGSLSISLAGRIGWPAINILLAALYLPIILLVWKSPDPGTDVTAPRTLKEAVWHPFLSFLTRHHALAILTFLFFFKLADNLVQSLQRPFLVDMGYSDFDRGFSLAVVGLVANLVGTMAGGLLTSPLGLGRSLWIFGSFQLFSNAGYAFLAQQGGVDRPLMWGVLGFEALCSGLGNGAVGVMLLRMTQKRFSATQYALFASLFALPRVVAGPIAGSMAYAIGWEMFFWSTLPLGIPAFLLLATFAPWKARDIELRPAAARFREELSSRQLVARGLTGGIAAFVLASGLLAFLNTLREEANAPGGFDLVAQIAALFRPEDPSGWIALAGLLAFGAACGLFTSALSAARHGAGQELGFDLESA